MVFCIEFAGASRMIDGIAQDRRAVLTVDAFRVFRFKNANELSSKKQHLPGGVCMSAIRRFGPVTAVTGAILCATPGAMAQAPSYLEEIVVTAQKRAESLQETPISLVAFGAERLEKLGITDIGDLQGNVPNLQLSPHPNSATTPRIFIRGVGNFDDQITQDPSVAVYMDGVYIARNQGMGMDVADIERIEVLRGPQGTLYGRNATGGAINFITRAPELDTLAFSQTVGVGNRGHRRSRTMLNVPLGDTLAARFSYLISERDGYVRNSGSGESHFGSEDRQALRADFRWQPADDWDVRYAYDRSRIQDTPFFLASNQPLGSSLKRPRRSDPSVDDLQAHDVTIDGHQLTVSWDGSETLTLRSISAYREVDSFLYQDYLSGLFGPFASLITEDNVNQRQWSQEFQALGSLMDNRLEYVAGVYFVRDSGNTRIINVLPDPGVVIQANASIVNRAYAVYAQGTYIPNLLEDRLSVTVGGRWSRDQRRATLEDFLVSNGGLVPTAGPGRGSLSFNDFSPSLTLEYQLEESVNLYAKVATGYKSGGFNVRASSIESFQQGFEEESLISYEAGIKSEWLENRLRVNAAVFRADYDDIQLNTQSDLTDPTIADILNAGEATIQGAELELTAVPVPRLQLGLSYAYLSARYDRITDVTGSNVTDQYTFVNAPRHSVFVDLDYDIASLTFGDLSLNVNYGWQDRKAITSSTAQGRFTIPNYGLLNARLTLSEITGLPAGSLRVSLWGKNLENKTYAFLHAPLFGGMRAYGEPRTYGVDITYDY